MKNIKRRTTISLVTLLLIYWPVHIFAATLVWENNADADGYKLYNDVFINEPDCGSMTKDDFKNVEPVSGTSYPLDNLAPLPDGQLYCFSVTAYNEHGEGELSDCACWDPSSDDTTIDLTPPLPPIGIKLSN